MLNLHANRLLKQKRGQKGIVYEMLSGKAKLTDVFSIGIPSTLFCFQRPPAVWFILDLLMGKPLKSFIERKPMTTALLPFSILPRCL